MKKLITRIVLSLTMLSLCNVSLAKTNKQKKIALAKAITYLSQAGAFSIGPKNSSLSSFRVYSFEGSRIGMRKNSDLYCNFLAVNEKRQLETFEYHGKNCNETVKAFHEAGLSKGEYFASVQSINCMLSTSKGSIIDMTCNVSQPFVDWN